MGGASTSISSAWPSKLFHFILCERKSDRDFFWSPSTKSMACMPCAESKWACGCMHGEDHKMLNIAERVARALEGQKEALEA